MIHGFFSINQVLNFTREVMSWDSFRPSRKRTSWLGAKSTIWESSPNSGCLLFSFTHHHPSTCLFSLKSFQLLLPLKLTSRESSRDLCLQSRFKSWFLFPLWRMYRAGWGPFTPQLALGRDKCLWFFPPWQTFPTASRYGAGILQQHNSLTPGWESTSQNSVPALAPQVTAFWGEKSPSIQVSSRPGAAVIPEISEKPCWLLEGKKTRSFNNLQHFPVNDICTLPTQMTPSCNYIKSLTWASLCRISASGATKSPAVLRDWQKDSHSSHSGSKHDSPEQSTD